MDRPLHLALAVALACALLRVDLAFAFALAFGRDVFFIAVYVLLFPGSVFGFLPRGLCSGCSSAEAAARTSLADSGAKVASPCQTKWTETKMAK